MPIPSSEISITGKALLPDNGANSKSPRQQKRKWAQREARHALRLRLLRTINDDK
jgi:hypothetical protein